jgi:NAD(P)-dependent dehydrogenase (short-subunit alcohol dehydrogenase family)
MLYAAAKAALEHLTKSLALEFAAEKRITVNSVMPGLIATS